MTYKYFDVNKTAIEQWPHECEEQQQQHDVVGVEQHDGVGVEQHDARVEQQQHDVVEGERDEQRVEQREEPSWDEEPTLWLIN